MSSDPLPPASPPVSSLPASIVIPTRARLPYLDVALTSVMAQAKRAGAEVLVIDDAGPSVAARALVEGHGARYEPHDRPRGLNVARNTGVSRSCGELVVFVDDDIRAREGWLQALLDAARGHPEVEVFAGPIRPCLEGRAPRSCGREHPPITALELGPDDTRTRYAWGANMAIRRSALERTGPFEESLQQGGDEQEWQDRLTNAARGGTDDGRGALYVAAAGVEHRRSGRDARLRSLVRGAYVRGRAARRFDAWRGEAPALRGEVATLARCAGHVLLRRCPAGSTMVAHSAGRLREALGERRASSRAAGDGADDLPAPRDDFLSGTSGTVGGLDAHLREARDLLTDAGALASGRRLRLALAARRLPARRSVLVLGVERSRHRALAARAQAELRRSRHDLELHFAAPGGRGKFENLNLLLQAHPPAAHDWLLILDDDVVLPRGFLDGFLFLCERFSLSLAQPAHRRRSHTAWPQARRRAGSVVRETRFVEIGPVTAFAHATFEVLLPFPALRMGWGLDAHWAALAGEHGWRCGITDAVAIAHRAAPAADAYSREAALAEAREFLAGRSYVKAAEAKRTLATHRHW